MIIKAFRYVKIKGLLFVTSGFDIDSPARSHRASFLLTTNATAFPNNGKHVIELDIYATQEPAE